MKILLGDVSSYKAIAIAKFIHNNYPEVIIFSFDSREFTKTIHTKYIYKNFIIKQDDIESYIRIIEEYKIDVFVPVINEALKNFWRNKERFNESLNYLGDFPSYQILNDKSQLHNLAMELNISVPEKYPDLSSAKFPFIIKPTNLSSSKGVIYVNKSEDIPGNYDTTNIIIQQFVKGRGVGFSFYCKNGKIINGYGHMRLAEYPVLGGSSTYRSHYQDERMCKISRKIVEKLNYTGFAMFEFKLTDKNELYLLEVNPRIWGSINLGLINGTNYFEEILGIPEKATKKVKKHKNTYLSPLIYVSFLKYSLRFNFKPIIYFLKNILNNSPDIGLIDDPKGFLSTILRKIYL